MTATQTGGDNGSVVGGVSGVKLHWKQYRRERPGTQPPLQDFTSSLEYFKLAAASRQGFLRAIDISMPVRSRVSFFQTTATGSNSDGHITINVGLRSLDPAEL